MATANVAGYFVLIQQIPVKLCVLSKHVFRRVFKEKDPYDMATKTLAGSKFLFGCLQLFHRHNNDFYGSRMLQRISGTLFKKANGCGNRFETFALEKITAS